MRGKQFADMDWNPRWNNAEQAAALSQDGHNVMFVTSMGIIHFDLREFESVSSFIGQMECALQMLAKAKVEYDKAVGNAGVRGARRKRQDNAR